MALQAQVPPGILALMGAVGARGARGLPWALAYWAFSNAQDPRVQELAPSVAAATRHAAEAAARATAEADAVSAVSRVYDKHERHRCAQASWRQQWSCCSWQRRCSSVAQSVLCHWGVGRPPLGPWRYGSRRISSMIRRPRNEPPMTGPPHEPPHHQSHVAR